MKTKTSESNKRISFPISLFEKDEVNPVTLSSEIHVVPTGTWMHWSGQEFSIDTDTIKELVRNFREGVRKDIPITAGHDNGMSGGELPAVGWFKDVVDKGVQGLYAFVEWTAEGNRLLRDKAFKYFSAELQFDYQDLETGISKDAVLVGGALTNKPFFKQLDMDPVAAFSDEQKKKLTLSFSVDGIINQFNLNDKTMDLKTILAKSPSDLSVEEKAFVNEHKAELDATQLEAFKSVIETPAETAEEKKAREDKEAADKKAKEDADAEKAKADKEAANVAAGLNPDGTAKIDASEKKTVTLSEAEVIALRARADLADKTFAELNDIKVGAKVEKMLLSESNKDGKFLPKEKTALISFVKTLSETQKDQFVNLVNLIPAKAAMFKEAGDAGDTAPAGAKALAEKMDVLAKAKMEASEKVGKKISYSQALKIVQKENPELFSEYDKSGSEE